MTAGSKTSFVPPLWVLTLAAALLSVYLIIELKEIFVLLVVGYSLAYVMNPALRGLQKRGVPRPAGVFILYTVALVFVIVLALTALPVIGREYSKLSANLPQYVQIAKTHLAPILDRLADYLPSETEDSWMPPVSGETLNRVLNAVGKTLLRGYSVTLTIINIFLLPFIVFYLAVDWESLHSSSLKLFPVLSRSRVAGTALEIDSYVSAFLHGQLIVASILFFLYALGLKIIGVQLWLLLAVIAGFGNIIPYLGFLSGIVLSSVMALVTFGTLSSMLVVWGLFVVVQVLEGSFITPRVLGEKVGLSPLVIILAIFAGGKLFGLLGVFLAVPAAAALRVLLSHGHSWVLKR